eukprot:CAMPEP_0171880686 /NCGR_PEP_ID=MMETSP0992-20121227/38584_1 /TAXON_ID=483369 /ORGANISM="non described non described, Strain CCMP2098" /LENGTH=63 /DNA_ID=CAMNT_0012506463 /DNA_START=91 /DNA_END=279 /DNA_ORIENTATION=+
MTGICAHCDSASRSSCTFSCFGNIPGGSDEDEDGGGGDDDKIGDKVAPTSFGSSLTPAAAAAA